MTRNNNLDCMKTFVDEPLLRYYIKVDNVWEYLVDPCAEEIADNSKTISGWCTTSGCEVIRKRYPEAKDIYFISEQEYFKAV